MRSVFSSFGPVPRPPEGTAGLRLRAGLAAAGFPRCDENRLLIKVCQTAGRPFGKKRHFFTQRRTGRTGKIPACIVSLRNILYHSCRSKVQHCSVKVVSPSKIRPYYNKNCRSGGVCYEQALVSGLMRIVRAGVGHQPFVGLLRCATKAGESPFTQAPRPPPACPSRSVTSTPAFCPKTTCCICRKAFRFTATPSWRLF